MTIFWRDSARKTPVNIMSYGICTAALIFVFCMGINGLVEQWAQPSIQDQIQDLEIRVDDLENK